MNDKNDTVWMYIEPRRLLALDDVDQTFTLEMSITTTWSVATVVTL